MLNQAFGEIPDNIGYIVSPIVKIVVMIVMIVLFLAILKKYRIKKQVITRNVAILLFILILAPLFSSFDILLGWEYFLSSPPDKTYFGMSLAFLMNGTGNIFYMWFVLEVFYDKTYSLKKRHNIILLIALIEVCSTIFALVLRLQKNQVAFIFTVIHMLVSMYIYLMFFINSLRSRGIIIYYNDRFVCN